MYARAHDTRLWYRSEGAGDPVVLLHGLGDDHGLWRHQLTPLAERHRVIAMDLRGHGRSRIGAVPFTLDEMADDVGETLDLADIGRAVVVGLSMGGGVAQALAIRSPDRVRALGLVSTSSEFPPATHDRFVQRAAVAERKGMAAVIEQTVPRWFTPEFAAANPAEVERTRSTVLAIDPAAFAAASRANAIRDFTGRLREIRCPVLFVGGAEDPAGPTRALEIYRRELADLDATLVPGASHLVPVERPTTFTELLLRFLAKLEPDHHAGGVQ